MCLEKRLNDGKRASVCVCDTDGRGDRQSRVGAEK